MAKGYPARFSTSHVIRCGTCGQLVKAIDTNGTMVKHLVNGSFCTDKGAWW